MISNVLVVGAGSAGLLAAVSLKRSFPELTVRVLRDPDTPVIGVGESTTPNIPQFLFETLKLSPRHFYQTTKATWKIGIHFLWGKRDGFEYTFTRQLDARWHDLPYCNGFYADEDFTHVDVGASLMQEKKAFLRNPNGIGPLIDSNHAFHLYNPAFVQYLEEVCDQNDIAILDGKFISVEKGPNGVEALILSDSRRLTADFFVDATGFRSELLGRTLDEPFESYANSLFCDRCVVGSWDRTSEPILPYTTVETMDAGWCWRIEHEHAINRGYVFSSSALSDDEARAEFLRKNPGATTWDHVLKFRSGRYRRSWVDNVVAMGNASGFVEPLEATAIMMICAMCGNLITSLRECKLTPNPPMRDLFNHLAGESWDDIKNFLSIHYRFNNRLDTPFWKRCRAEVNIDARKQLLDFYAANGPTGLCRYYIGAVGTASGLHSAFGLEGYLCMLLGMQVPYAAKHTPSPEELRRWNQHRAQVKAAAAEGLTVEQALAIIRHPSWRWNQEHGDSMRAQPGMFQPGAAHHAMTS